MIYFIDFSKSEYMADNIRKYEIVWFFSENYLIEVDRFIKEDYFDMVR